jgi:hypothetical protein
MTAAAGIPVSRLGGMAEDWPTYLDNAYTWGFRGNTEEVVEQNNEAQNEANDTEQGQGFEVYTDEA